MLENKKLLSEIALIALTYRLSYKNLAELLKKDEESIKDSLLSLGEYNHALNFLEIETQNENEEVEAVAYNGAYEYLNTRNNLLRLYNQKKKKNEDNSDVIRRIKEHQSEIDDSIIQKSLFSKNLSQEEKDKIARFRLKYYCSLGEAKSILHREKDTIKKLEDDLASRDPLFARKLEGLNSYYTVKNNAFVSTLGHRGQR